MTVRSETRRLLAAARRATTSDVVVAITVVALAPLVEVGLRTVGVRRTAGALRVHLVFDGRPLAGGSSRNWRGLAPGDRRRLAIAWRILELGPFDGTCLRRALIGARIMRRHDHAVRIGVRKTSDGIKAHAWLEIDGVSLDPDAPEAFSAQWRRVGTE